MKIKLPENNFGSSPKDEVKDLILNWFKKMNSKAGHVMDQRNLLQSVSMKLNPKQDKVADEAINELVQDGLIEVKDNKLLVLTEKGVDHIY